MLRMDLHSFIKSMTGPQREAFADECETSAGHLRNVAYGLRNCATDLAVLIEQKSHGVVTRQELRSDWARHWPELAQSEQRAA